MASISPAAQSPRIVNNVIKWFFGDSFKIKWVLALQDGNGVPITYQANDKIVFSFYKQDTNCCVYSFTCPVTISSACTVAELVFTPEISKKFIPGKYDFNVKLVTFMDDPVTPGKKIPQKITTIGADNHAIVERSW